MLLHKSLLLLLVLCVLLVGTLAGETKLNAKDIMKMVMKKLPAGNDYSFKNVKTTVQQADGTSKSVFLNGKSNDEKIASIADDDDEDEF
jgi:hypothetical protein